MDPVSQGILGSTAALLLSNKKNRAHAAKVGFVAGLAADIDVIIKSATDPLLNLEVHRQFTHSLLFIPLGGLIVAFLLWLIVYRKIPFKETFMFAVAGYATHGILDAFTTYGTQLLWPFSNQRIAWDFVGIVDPLVTIPLIVAVIATCVNKHKKWIVIGSIFFVSYISFGALQHHRAVQATELIASANNQTVSRIKAMPTIGNLIAWRTIYQSGDNYYVNGLRVSLMGDVKVYRGGAMEVLNIEQTFPTLDTQSVQYNDIQRFKWFADDWIVVDESRPNSIADLRYSVKTNGLAPLWDISINPETPNEHIIYHSHTDGVAREIIPWDIINDK